MANDLQSKLTDGGVTKLTNAAASTIPIALVKYRIGEDAAIVLDPSLTDVVNQVHSGGIDDISYDITADDQVKIKITLDESVGPFDFGNIGLFTDDDTIITISTFTEEQIEKTPNAPGGVVGNRIVLVIPITFTNVGELIDFTLIPGAVSSWPFVQEIADLPDPLTAPFEGYIVREDPSQDKPITAIRNQTGPLTFEWAFDFHNLIDFGTSKVEIESSDGNINFNVSGTNRAIVNSTGLQIEDNHFLFLPTTGNAANPVLTFNGDDNTGLYRPGSDQLGFSAAGVQILNINSTSAAVLSGSVGSPGLSIIGDSNTGIFQPAADELGLSAGGVESLNIHNTGVSILPGSESVPGLSFIGDQDTGIFRSAPDQLAITAAGSEVVRFYASGMLNVLGSATAPSYSFIGDSNTGMYSPGSNLVSLTTTGVERFRVSDTEIRCNQNLRIPAGLTAAPSLYFGTDSDTGLFQPSTNTIGFSLAGGEVARMESNALVVSQAGSEGNPCLKINDDNTGFYQPAANEIGISVSGTQVGEWSSLGLNVDGLLEVEGRILTNTSGSASSPSVQLNDGSPTPSGLFKDDGLGVDNVSVTISSIKRAHFYSAGLNMNNFKVEAIANGTAGTDAVNLNQLNAEVSDIRQGDLATALQTGSVGAENSGVVFTGGQYCFSPQVRVNGGTYYNISRAQAEDGAGDNAMAVFASSSDSGHTLDFRVRYMLSSPPYYIGGILIPFFAYVLLDSKNKVKATSFAIDPAWAYNGPTDTRADEYDRINKKAYKNRVYFKDGEVVRERIEITNDFKNSDMHVLPHPFQNIEKDKDRVILVAPDDKMMQDLIDLHDAGECLPEIVENGFLNFYEETELEGSPAGLIICKSKWKKKNRK